MIRLNLDNSDGLIKECARVQTNQKKLINKLKENLGKKSEDIDKVKKNTCYVNLFLRKKMKIKRRFLN